MTSIKTKKIILFVVEGPTDRTTLENAFRNAFRIRHRHADVKIKVVHGDYTLKNASGKLISPSSILEETTRFVTEYLRVLKETDGVRPSDILAIAQITDLDASFADSSCFVYDSQSERVCYDVDQRLVCSNHIDDIFELRQGKRVNMLKLYSHANVKVSKISLPYHLFYFGINLEHALYGKPNCTDNEKMDLSESFDDQYGDDYEGFMSKIQSIASIDGNYYASWSEDKLESSAFLPISNISCIFDWIKTLIDAYQDS